MGTARGCLLCGGILNAWSAFNNRHYERCSHCGLLSVPEGLAVDSHGVSVYESQVASVFEADGNESSFERMKATGDTHAPPPEAQHKNRIPSAQSGHGQGQHAEHGGHGHGRHQISRRQG